MKQHKPKPQPKARRARKHVVAGPDIDVSDDQLISADQTCAMLGGCSRMHLWRLVNDPDKRYRALHFPRPITIGRVGRHERKFFRLGDVRAWIASRAAAVETEAA
jgi:predicted DNA-binding transcriptional regulator AlpA